MANLAGSNRRMERNPRMGSRRSARAGETAVAKRSHGAHSNRIRHRISCCTCRPNAACRALSQAKLKQPRLEEASATESAQAQPMPRSRAQGLVPQLAQRAPHNDDLRGGQTAGTLLRHGDCPTSEWRMSRARILVALTGRVIAMLFGTDVHVWRKSATHESSPRRDIQVGVKLESRSGI